MKNFEKNSTCALKTVKIELYYRRFEGEEDKKRKSKKEKDNDIDT